MELAWHVAGSAVLRAERSVQRARPWEPQSSPFRCLFWGVRGSSLTLFLLLLCPPPSPYLQYASQEDSPLELGQSSQWISPWGPQIPCLRITWDAHENCPFLGQTPWEVVTLDLEVFNKLL